MVAAAFRRWQERWRTVRSAREAREAEEQRESRFWATFADMDAGMGRSRACMHVFCPPFNIVAFSNTFSLKHHHHRHHHYQVPGTRRRHAVLPMVTTEAETVTAMDVDRRIRAADPPAFTFASPSGGRGRNNAAAPDALDLGPTLFRALCGHGASGDDAPLQQQQAFAQARDSFWKVVVAVDAVKFKEPARWLEAKLAYGRSRQQVGSGRGSATGTPRAVRRVKTSVLVGGVASGALTQRPIQVSSVAQYALEGRDVLPLLKPRLDDSAAGLRALATARLHVCVTAVRHRGTNRSLASDVDTAVPLDYHLAAAQGVVFLMRTTFSFLPFFFFFLARLLIFLIACVPRVHFQLV